MPTADDFETAAARLRNIAADLEVFVQPLEDRMGPHVLEGGELTDSVYESMKSGRVTALSLAAVVADYAAECSRRQAEAIAAANALDDYEDDLDDYAGMQEIWDEHDGKKGWIKLDEPPEKPTPPPALPDYIDL